MPKRFTPNDKWSRKASEDGFRARSVYKLQEIDEKFRLIRPGMTILDLGCAPGSWLQYCAEKCRMKNAKCRIIGLDLQEVEPIENTEIHVCDFTDTNAVANIIKADELIPTSNSSPNLSPSPNPTPVLDLLLSDAAPSTSGIRDVDQWRSIELCQQVLEIADRFLKRRGTVVMKVFRGADFDEFLRELKEKFSYVKVLNVRASRDRSFEVFVVCQEKQIGN